MIKWGIYGLSALLIGGAASALVVREYRHADDWRICSDIGAYNFEYKNRQVVFDDGVMADQAFEMRGCANNVSLKNCSMSIIDFVNPIRVTPEEIELDFSVERLNGEVIANIPNKENASGGGGTRITFKEDGSFVSLTAEQGGVPTTFRQCEFPLLR